MKWLTDRFNYLFSSTKGLILVAIAMIALVTAIWGTLSGPLAEWGVKDFTVRVLGMRLDPIEREGRIIILYHTIAMAVVAIETYMITSLVPMKDARRTAINATITVGYMAAMVFGLAFAYFGHNFVFHGVFLFGQSLVFFAGVMLTVALWPWQKEYRVKSKEYSHFFGDIDGERMAFFIMALAMLGSALFGAVPGSLWGNGHETFLAEDVVREPHKSPLQLAVIGHLHIMLTLIAVALALIIGRWFDFKGILHKWAMPLMIIGTIITTIGVWMVVPFEAIAHIIINIGATPILTASLLLAIYGWGKLIRERLAEKGIENPSFADKVKALLHDPLRFGSLWQMIYMNFPVTFIGIYMAIELDEVFRVWPWREERIALTGHWHILSGIIATIILLYYADIAGLKGKVRQWFGWIVIIGSDLAFAGATVYSIKRLFVDELSEQAFVKGTMLFIEIGLAAVLIALGALMAWRLVDLFRPRGRWSEEFSDPELAPGDEIATGSQEG